MKWEGGVIFQSRNRPRGHEQMMDVKCWATLPTLERCFGIGQRNETGPSLGSAHTVYACFACSSYYIESLRFHGREGGVMMLLPVVDPGRKRSGLTVEALGRGRDDVEMVVTAVVE